MRRTMLAVLVIGAAMIAAPLVMQLPDRADGGQKMIDAFEPIMDEGNVEQTADYYYEVFVPLGDVVPAMTQENIDEFNGYVAGFEALGVEAEQLVPALSGALGMTSEEVEGFLASQFPGMSAMFGALPQMQEDFTALLGLMDANVAIFEQVPAGLAHYEPLVTTMQGQQANYDRIAGLPDFRLFTWFFVVPGALLVLIGLRGLVRSGKGSTT